MSNNNSAAIFFGALTGMIGGAVAWITADFIASEKPETVDRRREAADIAELKRRRAPRLISESAHKDIVMSAIDATQDGGMSDFMFFIRFIAMVRPLTNVESVYIGHDYRAVTYSTDVNALICCYDPDDVLVMLIFGEYADTFWTVVATTDGSAITKKMVIDCDSIKMALTDDILKAILAAIENGPPEPPEEDIPPMDEL